MRDEVNISSTENKFTVIYFIIKGFVPFILGELLL